MFMEVRLVFFIANERETFTAVVRLLGAHKRAVSRSYKSVLIE